MSEKRLTPVEAIRKYCLGCCGYQWYQSSEVRNCGFYDCPLYLYRLGHNPSRKGIKGKDMTKVREAIKTRVET